MKRKWIAEKRGNVWRSKFLSLLLFSLFLSGCGYHDNQFSYFNMLDTEKRTLKNKKAAEKFWSSVRPVSTLSTSHYKLGRYYQQQGKYSKSITEFIKAVRNDSSYCKAYNGIAMSYDALKRCEKARDSYEQALQCDSKGAYLYNNYACSSLLCGDYEKGLALLHEAVRLSEDNNRIRNNLKLAQTIVDLEKNSDELISKELSVATAAETFFEPAGNNNETSLIDPIYEIPDNSFSEEVQSGVEINEVVTSEVDIPDRFDRLPSVSTVIEERVSPSKENIRVADKKATHEFVSSIPKNNATVRLVTEKINKTIVRNRIQASENHSNGAVEVSNGNGVTGMAGRSADYFRGHGFNIRRITNAKNFYFDNSVIFYREGYLLVAKELARVIPGAQNIEKVDSLERASIGVRVLLGKDLANVRFPEGYAQIVVDYSTLAKESLLASTY